ncbi:MAG TPA: hypothetical protein VJZ01_08085 [Lachnospiraceae bacterium]|nr:hypothetical protein [Lachnospiraceae bacterium]
MDTTMMETMHLILDKVNAMDVRFDAMDARFDKMDDRFDKMDVRFDTLEDKVHEMGLYIENVVNKNTQTLFDAYQVTQSHFIDVERVNQLEETVKMHGQVISNHSAKLNQLCSG